MQEINRFGSSFAANRGFLAALENDFSVSSLMKVANENGYKIGAAEVESEMAKLIANSKIRISYKGPDGGMRELTLDEAQLAAGRGAIVYTVVGVVVAVAAGAVAVIAVAAATYAAVYTSAAVYSSVYLWG